MEQITREYFIKNERDRFTYKTIDITNNLIDNLSKYRKLQNMTQKELSKITGISTGTISKIENGDSIPTTVTLVKYLLGLGVDINDIFRL